MQKLTKSAPNLALIIVAALFILAFVPQPFIPDSEKSVNKKNTVMTNEVIEGAAAMQTYGNWKTFTKKDGLPSNKVFSVKTDGARIWAGTDAGLALYEDGIWQTFTTEDGLPHNGVLSIDISLVTGDLWVATLGGLSRFSAGKFDTYTQFNSGLPNDVIYQVVCDGKDVWVATGGGAGRLNTYTGEWDIFTERNAPMHEPWTYGVTAGNGKVFIAAWGGGVIEYDKRTEQFRDYVDPDGEMELDLFPDDGVVHDITTGVSYSNAILWVATYFGLSRYDGNHWRGYFDHDSGLVSNFINYLRANDDVVWLCTDNGVSSFNGKQWISYQKFKDKAGGQVITRNGNEIKTVNTTSSIAHNFVLSVDFQDDNVWLATSDGLSVGTPLSSFFVNK
jgi:ligand-binding sensor domain-containing protein